MSEHKITLNWKRTTPDFKYETYDRTQNITFDGGHKMQVSSAPQFLGKSELPNPEEMLIAAVSSCYALTFLAVSAKSGFVVDGYSDNASGILGKNEKGKTAITEVVLRPKIIFSGSKQPDATMLSNMHQKSEANCFITNSILAKVKIEA